MNFSAIQPEPRIPQRITGASLAGLIRDEGNDFGSDMEATSLMVQAVGIRAYASQAAVCRVKFPIQF